MGDLWVPEWTRGTDPCHPEPVVGTAAFSAYYMAPRAEERNRNRITVTAQPARVRICGPIGGSLITADTALLRAEAERLLDVADTLELVQQATATTLEGIA